MYFVKKIHFISPISEDKSLIYFHYQVIAKYTFYSKPGKGKDHENPPIHTKSDVLLWIICVTGFIRPLYANLLGIIYFIASAMANRKLFGFVYLLLISEFQTLSEIRNSFGQKVSCRDVIEHRHYNYQVFGKFHGNRTEFIMEFSFFGTKILFLYDVNYSYSSSEL